MPLLHKTQNPCHTSSHGRQERRNQETSFSLVLVLVLLVLLLTQNKNYVPSLMLSPKIRTRFPYIFFLIWCFTSPYLSFCFPKLFAPNPLPSLRGSRVWPKFTLGIHAALRDSPLTSICSSISLMNLMSGKCWFLLALPTEALFFNVN
jgi:hypothetical protein